VDRANDGSVTDEALLVLVDEAIAAILSGGAVKGWREGAHEVEHLSLNELLAFKREIENRLAAAGGGICLPVREVDL
jgi:hypothetical protein